MSLGEDRQHYPQHKDRNIICAKPLQSNFKPNQQVKAMMLQILQLQLKTSIHLQDLRIFEFTVTFLGK